MTHPQPFRARAAVAVLALALSGCFSGWGRPDNPFRPGDSPPVDIRVSVENQNFSDATIYAVRGGQRTRLGDVTGLSESTFTMRLEYAIDLYFEGSLVGRQSCRTSSIPVNPGDHVRVRIPANLNAGRCESSK